MLQPKRSRYRKHHKPVHRCVAKNTNQLRFGEYGIQARAAGRLSARHLEALRRVCTRMCRRQGRIWVCVYPHWVLSRKSAESRMGKGKGAPTIWVVPVPAGGILVELSGMSMDMARAAAHRASYKLPIPTQFITRYGVAG